MNKQVRLTGQEQALLRKLSNDQLIFLTEIRDHKRFSTLTDLVNILIDQEKNIFFGEDESRYTEGAWQSKHAYSRGGIAKMITLLHIIVGSRQELEKRSELSKTKMRG